MAHRLPPAGTKSARSEHFEFCQVVPQQEELKKDYTTCVERVGACLLRPKFVALPVVSQSDKTKARGCNDKEEDLHIQCFCYEDSGWESNPNPGLSLRTPLRVCCPDTARSRPRPRDTRSDCQNIIVLKPPEGATQDDRKCSGTAGCRLTNMRCREVAEAEPEKCSSPVFLEFVDDPFLTSNACGGSVEQMENSQQNVHSDKGSLAVNVGSHRPCCWLSAPMKEAVERFYVPVMTTDCRPCVPDFRRRKPMFTKV